MPLAFGKVSGGAAIGGADQRAPGRPNWATRVMNKYLLRAVVQFILLLMPWSLRRNLLNTILGFNIHPTARIGLSVILADQVEIGGNASIGHFTYLGKLDRLLVEEHSIVGNFNWVPGLSRKLKSPAYSDAVNRRSDFIMRAHSALTNRHVVDCTDAVEIGAFVTVAGLASQIITHGIDIETNRQTCAPISIGKYSLIGSRVVILKGVKIPPYSIVGAGSIVPKGWEEPYRLVAGNPATIRRTLPADAGYFTRDRGFVL
jgi:acetyltransferase-like isoleucine patch superfamily enzyme